MTGGPWNHINHERNDQVVPGIILTIKINDQVGPGIIVTMK